MTDYNIDIDSLPSVYLVPTSHVSQNSVQLVKDTISSLDPEIVCVELDTSRYKSLQQNTQRKLTLRSSLRSPNMSLQAGLMAYTLGKIQQHIANRMPINFSGEEMYTACQLANDSDATTALIDQDISETLNRLSNELSTRDKLQMVGELLVGSIFFKLGLGISSGAGSDSENQFDLKDLEIEEIIELLEDEYPTIKRILIDERDVYMANNVLSIISDMQTTSTYDVVQTEDDISEMKIVCVVGAGHVPGMTQYFTKWNVPVTVLSNTDDLDQELRTESN